MEMIIDFPGGSRVDAHFGKFTVATDQPLVASAPAPFAVFLSSIDYLLLGGDTARARAILQDVVRGPQWAAFGAIAAEAELARTK